MFRSRRIASVLLALCAILATATARTATRAQSPPSDDALPQVELIHTTASDRSGVTVEWVTPQPVLSSHPAGDAYASVGFRDGQPSGKAGEPELPVGRIMVGAPPGAAVSVRVTPGPPQDLGVRRIGPVPELRVVSERDGIQRVEPSYREDRAVYGRAGYAPASLAAMVLDGTMRDRRVVQVEVRPVQYEASTGRLRYFPRMTVRVDFGQSSGSDTVRSRVSDSPDFDDYFARLLVNNDAAKAWRATPARVATSPAVETGAAVKLFVSRAGIYRVTGKALAAYGFDLKGVVPHNLRMTRGGKEIPIYISGDADGRLDEGDSIDFLAVRPASPWSKYDVYRLSVGTSRGLRVGEAEGAPRNPIASLIPSFRSKIHFEQNKLHSILQHVTPEEIVPNDPHAWFEARDHWYWFGVKNGEDRSEATEPFALYDVAKTFDAPRVDLLLQGGTPVNHDALVTVNEAKIARVTGWAKQDERRIGRYLQPDALVDAVQGDNTIRLMRVDANDDDDLDNYPYHFYVNSMDIEYTRLFRAVTDELYFASPVSDKPWETRRRNTLEYAVTDFLDNGIAVYEHNGQALITRLRNVEVERQAVSLEMRQRLNAIQRRRNERETSPSVMYAARFQAMDTHDTQYVAVSAKGVLEPDIIELDTPANLRDPGLGADYVVIYHPRFVDAAQKLVDWRSSRGGGGHRALKIDITDIYDEFGHGMVSDRAIKDFLTYAFVNWQAPALAYVTILADGTWDVYGTDAQRYPEAPERMGFVPPHYVWSLFGQSAADHWYSTVSGIDPLPDFFIGRLPVEAVDQANAVVDKIIRYESAPPNGSWRRRILSVADDDTTNSGDFIFRQSLSDISQNHTLLGYETVKVFLEDIIDEVKSIPDKFKGRRAAQVARERIVDSLSDGAIISQYAGHGGRQVWAHEIIFDNPAVQTLRPTDRISLMFVLSCYNGYFDAPAEPSLAESLLRLPQGGIIAMVSATRLTFGSGNDALNRIVFDDIFKRNARSLGEIATTSKSRLLVEQGLSHLETMQQYTLFGDPATRLHLADYDIQPAIAERSVQPGGKLRIAAGNILRSTYDSATDSRSYSPITDFDGRLVVTSRFTRQVTGEPIEVAAEGTVTRGAFAEVVLTVPLDALPGKAQVEYYAESATSLAVGGSTFAVSEPVIEQVDIGVESGAIRLALRVVDDREVGSVEVEWYSRGGRGWTMTPLLRDTSRGNGWYALAVKIPEPESGESFDYILHIADTDGHSTSTDIVRYTPVEIPDWRVLPSEERREPLIGYVLDPSLGWAVTVNIENLNDISTDVPLPVAFYLGNPDTDRDGQPDGDARRIGVATIFPTSWRKGDPLGPPPDPVTRLRTSQAPLNTRWTAHARLAATLDTGNHLIFAWVNPPDVANRASGERDTSNNISSRLIEVNSRLAGDSSMSLASLDDAFRIDLPSDAFPQPKVVSITGMTAAPTGQRLLTALPPVSGSHAYRASADGEELSSRARLELHFDLSAFRRSIIERIGLAETPEEEWTEQDRQLLAEATRSALATAAIYRWLPDQERWRRVEDSALMREADQTPRVAMRLAIQSSGVSAGPPPAIVLDGTRVREGDWVALFRGPMVYDLYHRSGSEALARVAQSVAVLNSTTAPIPAELAEFPALVLTFEQRPRRFGDVVKLQTAPAPDGSSQMVARSIFEGSIGNGVVQSLSVDPNAGNALAGSDPWIVFFVTDSEYEVRSATGALMSGGQPRRGKTGEVFFDATTGLRMALLAGSIPYEAGDVIRITSKETGAVRATTPSLGAFAVFTSQDVSAPTIAVSVTGQDFAAGDPVPPEPRFHVVASDDSGIALTDLALTLSHDGSEFMPAPPDQTRVLAAPGSGQVMVDYTPDLEPGDYVLRIVCRDLDGREATSQTPFRVAASSELRSALNYPNPFRTHTDLAIEATGEIDELTVRVYSLAGRVVRDLSHPPSAGFVRIRWDGRDSDGAEVANGVYYAQVRMKARGKSHTEIIKLLKMK